MSANPASPVRGPSHSPKRGKTPVLDPVEARALLDSIGVTTAIGRRECALIGLMVYSFARIGAALAMKVEDVYVQNRRLWVRLHEKGGKRHELPCHHNLEDLPSRLHRWLWARERSQGSIVSNDRPRHRGGAFRRAPLEEFALRRRVALSLLYTRLHQSKSVANMASYQSELRASRSAPNLEMRRHSADATRAPRWPNDNPSRQIEAVRGSCRPFHRDDARFVGPLHRRRNGRADRVDGSSHRVRIQMRITGGRRGV